MALSLDTPTARRMALALSLLTAFPVAYFSIRAALAERFAEQNTPQGLGRAIRLEPGDAEAWYLLGRYWHYNLEQQDVARAVSYYQHALAINPYSAGMRLDLAEAYEDEGRIEEAASTYRAARSAYPISPEISWREGNYLLRQGKITSAYADFRRAVSGQPSLAASVVSRCWRANPDANPILTSVLPPTREAYLAALRFFVDEGQTDAAIAAWQRLRAVGAGLPLRDSFSLQDLLIHAGRIQDARQIWEQARALADTPEPPTEQGSLVWDGGFETDFTQGGFGWRVQQLPHFQADFDKENKHSGVRALRIRFDGKANLDFSNVFQYVAVEPETTYHLSGWLRTNNISTDSGVRLLVYDPSDPARTSGMTSDLIGTEPWVHLELTLTTGRETHLLLLCVRRMPSTKLDNKLGGTAWVDDVTLIPVGAAGKIR
jgi:tetratricopeptide (TPR) repeat protein